MTTFVRNKAGQQPEWRVESKSWYKLESAKGVKTLRFAAGVMYRVTQHDDESFITVVAGGDDSDAVRWVRVDPQRYFIVFAAGRGTPAIGAPAFAALIRSDSRQIQTDAFGLYPVRKGTDVVVVDTIPEDVLKEFARESGDGSVAMLRLEITAAAYARALKVLQTWERRKRENTLLYPYPYLNNAVYIDEVALSLNKCSQTIKMYSLNWRFEDPLNQRRDLPQVPYYNIMELRRLNQSLHVEDDRFYAQWQAINLPLKR